MLLHGASFWLRCLSSILTLTLVAAAPAQPAAADSKPQFLSDNPELILASTQGWGKPGWDAPAHVGDQPGGPLRIGDRTFTKGLGHHANGSITVLLDGAFHAFEAEVGLQPCPGGSVVFRVIVDGQSRFQSEVLRSGDAPVAVQVRVEGARELRLEAADAGDGVTCDMANWANARLTPTTNRVASGIGQRVDIGRFGRVATWDPNRSDGARADRVHEFNVEDLFTDRDLGTDSNARLGVPVATNQLASVGLQWLNRRVLREARLTFAETAQVPPTNAVRVEGWFGESAWQGEFKPLAGTLEREGDTLVFHAAPRADHGGLLQTLKLRWVFPATNAVSLKGRPEAYTRSRWALTYLTVQTTNAPQGSMLEMDITNGELLQPAAAPLSYRMNVAFRIQVRHARFTPLKSDPTVLLFRLSGEAFGVAVEDVLSRGYVYVPEHGLLVTTFPPRMSTTGAQQKIAASKTILEEVRQRPDQTFAQAMARTHHAAQQEGPVMLSLACDNTKFVVERDGRIRFQEALVTDTDWTKDAGELRPEFGDGAAQLVRRQLDGGWLPSPVMTYSNAGVIYSERVYVAPLDEPGTNAARLNRPSVCVAEFTLTNRQSTAAPARLALSFDVNRREKKAAQIVKTAAGWLVTGERGSLGLVTSPPDWEGEASVEGGKLVFSHSLPPNAGARFTVFLGADAGRQLNLPPVARLRAAFESYWNAVLAPALQIETPDSRLNDVIRSSQVRCLIAARNEAEGRRVAAWIAALHYGPLESEAHSVIRGMTFFGHDDFARRSLDYFIHRYNTNGFLTTGYTTFGTAWHLWTVGEHHRLHPDPAWLCANAPELARVGEWIVRQTGKTTQAVAARRPESGLMPPGVLADWNAFAYHFAHNAYYHAALRELGALLWEVADPRGATISGRAVQLREDTLRAYRWTQARSPVVPLRNGVWTAYYPSQVHSPGPLGDFFPGQDAGRSWCYDVELGAHQMVPTGVLDANSSEVGRMLDHMEDVQFLADGWFDYPAATNQADWFNLGGFSKVQPYYTRNAEIYALRDDVKPFLRSYFNSLAALLNPEVLTLWEHFNHSGAWDKTHETGYFLHQTREMLVQERGDQLWLAPLIPSDWLKDGLGVGVTNAPTRFGRVSYRLNSKAASGAIEAHIEPPARSAPKAIVLRLRHPDGKRLSTVTVNGQPHTDFDPQKETVRLIPDGTTAISVRASY